MVFEDLLNPKKAERRPYEVFFIGLLYSTIAIIFSLLVFKGHGSLVMVTLTIMACTFLMYNIIKLEERKDEHIKSEKILIKEHGKALSFFAFLFLGLIVSFSLWYSILPKEQSEKLFELQLATIQTVNSPITGQAISPMNELTSLFLSNLKVMAFAIIFSLAYGFGAIFILAWNASVIGAAIGTFVKNNLLSTSIPAYMGTYSIGLLKYSIHGIPEMTAYFTAALAGGIISVAVIKHHFKSQEFRHILLDSFDLIILAVALLFLSAVIEIFVTPVLF